MKAHQRLIREQEAARDQSRAVIPLDRCVVKPVSKAWAKKIILRYEWLGTMANSPLACYGLCGPDGEALGAVVFGNGMGSRARMVCGEEWFERSTVLERGACVHYAHEHAGSFLISRAVKLVARDHGIRVVLAYSDQDAGEIGTLYQACNWLYLGAGNGRGENASRVEGRLIGTEKWQNSRVLRRAARRAGYEDTSKWWEWARSSGLWEFRRVADRSRYVTFTGPRYERNEALRALRYPVLPYPKRKG